MSTSVSVTEAENQMRRLLQLAQQGHEVIIHDPVAGAARLVPFQQETNPKARVLGLHPGNIWQSDDFNSPLPDSFWAGDRNA